MRAWFRLAAVGVVCAAAVVRPACADPVTIRVSEVASGSFGLGDFTDKLVTLEAHFNSQDYLNCIADGQDPLCDIYTIDAGAGLTETVTVAGLGTLEVGGSSDAGVSYLLGGPSSGTLFVGDFSNLLGIGVLLNNFDGSLLQPFGPQTGPARTSTSYATCDDRPSRCPTNISLVDGSELLFDAVAPTATAEIIVGSPVPEPGTWMMVGTGLVGGVGAMRRRLRRLP